MKRLLLCLLLVILSLGASRKSIGKTPGECSYNPTTTLYIYGGKNEEDYLGKLNASKYDSESIWNKHGKYGSKYSSMSIWNQHGTYGSKYSSYSPFNSHASYPPVLRDKNGKFHGYFTINKYKSQRADFDVTDIICDNYERIRDKVDEWYDVIF